MREFLDKGRRATWWLLGSKFVNFFLTGAWTVLLVRQLSQPDYAAYNVFLSLAFYIELLSSSPFALGLRRYLPEAKSRPAADALVGLAIGLQLALAALLAGALALFSGPLSRFFKFNPAYLLPFWLLLFPWLQARLWDVISQITFSHHWMAPSRVLRSGIILVGLWAFSRDGLTVPEAMGALAIAEGAHLGVQVWAYLRARRGLKGESAKGGLLRRFLKFSFVSYAHHATGTFFAVPIDILLLSAFVNPVAVSVYALASNVHQVLSRVYPVAFLKEVVSPLLINSYVASGRQEDLVAGFNFFLKLFLFVELPIVLLFWGLGGRAFGWVFGTEYSGAWAVAAAFVSVQMANTFLFLLNTLATAVEKPQYLLYGRVFSLYNLLADIVFIKFLGVWGAALATGSALWALVAFLWFMLRRTLPLTIHRSGFLLLGLNSLVVALLGWGLSWFASGPWGLLGLIVVLVPLYYALSRFLNPFTPPERRIIQHLFGVKLL